MVIDDGNILGALHFAEHSQSQAHGATAVNENFLARRYAEINRGAVTLAEGKQHTRIYKINIVGKLSLQGKRKSFRAEAIVQHSLVVIDQAIFRHSTKGFGIAVAYLRP